MLRSCTLPLIYRRGDSALGEFKPKFPKFFLKRSVFFFCRKRGKPLLHNLRLMTALWAS